MGIEGVCGLLGQVCRDRGSLRAIGSGMKGQREFTGYWVRYVGTEGVCGPLGHLGIEGGHWVRYVGIEGVYGLLGQVCAGHWVRYVEAEGVCWSLGQVCGDRGSLRAIGSGM